MELQNISFSMTSNYYQVGKDNKETSRQNVAHALISPKSEFDKMIENIQEQIQKIQENDHYDVDTKKSKIEELEEQLKQVLEAQRTREAEAVTGKTPDKKNNTYDANTQVNADGDTLEIGLDTRAFIEADTNLSKAKNAYSMQKKLEGQSNVLKSEIKTDKARGVNTERKEAQLSKLTEGIGRTADKLGEAVKNANTSAPEQAYHASSDDKAQDEKLADENDEFSIKQSEY